MIDSIKDAYCTYLVQLLLRCENDIEVNSILDRISEGEFDKIVVGDNDLKRVVNHVYQHRLYNKNVISKKPEIELKTVMKAFAKSIF
ncbi:MAG: hypothetical protein ACOCP8_02970 [archaeon]